MEQYAQIPPNYTYTPQIRQKQNTTKEITQQQIYSHTPIGVAMKKTIDMMNFQNPELKKIFEEELYKAMENRFDKINNAYGVESNRSD